jgi:two-component system, OmpR family, phosphate regulon sensor histidine kinase PhoR
MVRRFLPPFVCLLPAAAAVLVLAALPGEAPGMRWLLAAAALAALTAAVVLAARAAGDTDRSLRALTDAVNRLAEGDASPHVFAESHDEVGALARAFVRTRDALTARIAALERDRDQLRTILGGMVEGVVALDAGQHVLFANERAAQLLDLPRPPVGRRLWEVVRRRAVFDLVRRCLDQVEPVRQELTLDGPAARTLTVHAARLPGPGPRGAVLVLHDTSELRRLERLRQEFVANVSHELKTPLSVIKLCGETLLGGGVDDEHRGRFLARIVGQAERLHALILDLLSLARIESGDEAFDLRAVPVRAAVEACLERHRPRAEARRQTLLPEPPPADADLAVWADEDAVDHILDNLLDNAVKYTPEGGHVRVGWRREGDQVHLTVADDGIGIPAADLPRVFERFYRVDKARSRELGGTGLGLSIVKHLAQALNGQVRVESTVGVGSAFEVVLPRAT